MPVQVTVSNRQRRVPLDLGWARRMTEKLVHSLFENLVGRPAAHLPLAALNDLGERGSLSLTFVSNRAIKELNLRWRNQNAATDVLSFPLGLTAPPAGLPWELGEVVISVEKAREQSDALGHSLERELAFLFAHGFLHVLGFDHKTLEEEKEMFGRQHEILENAGFSR